MPAWLLVPAAGFAVRHWKGLLVLLVAVVALPMVAMLAAGPILVSTAARASDGSGYVPCSIGDTQQVGSVAGLDAEQTANVAVILAVAEQHVRPWATAQGLDPDQTVARAQVIGIITAKQESGIRNLDYGHLDSEGMFQQRPSTGWGTPAQVRDPVLATTAFYGEAAHTSNPGLLDVPGWVDMPTWMAAQAVQRSAFPLAYADHEQFALALLSAAGSLVLPALCTASVGADGWLFPPLDGPYTISSRFGVGRCLSDRCDIHGGLDLAAAGGTPILAAATGTVVGAGPLGTYGNQVEIDHGQTGMGSIHTRYAHMSQYVVAPGDTVTKGQVIGYVGSTGRSTGDHLHLEVIQDGVRIDPEVFFAEQAQTQDQVLA